MAMARAFAALLLLPIVAACATQRTCCPGGLAPTLEAQDLSNCLDLGQALPAAVDKLRDYKQRQMVEERLGRVPDFNMLVLSGGGSFGAYGVGVLNGWRQHQAGAPNRPAFDFITGVSTGALISTFVYLGNEDPEWDRHLRELYLNVTNRDIYNIRPWVLMPFRNSIATTKPLERLIEREVTPELLAQVADQYERTGRGLFIGTVNLDEGRFCWWNLGAVAAGGHLDLYRKLVLASASVPVAFNPVYLTYPDENGNLRTQMHVDGSTRESLFILDFITQLDEAFTDVYGDAGKIRGDIYAIVNGFLDVPPKCLEDRLVPIVARTITMEVTQNAVDSLFRVQLFAEQNDLGFQFTSVPMDLDIPVEAALQFEPDTMERLFDAGFDAGRKGAWQTQTPDVDADAMLFRRPADD